MEARDQKRYLRPHLFIVNVIAEGGGKRMESKNGNSKSREVGSEPAGIILSVRKLHQIKGF